MLVCPVAPAEISILAEDVSPGRPCLERRSLAADHPDGLRGRRV